MARNAPDRNGSQPSHQKRRVPSRVSERVTNPPAAARSRSRRDRRQFWIQVIAALIVLAMLMPVIAFFL